MDTRQKRKASRAVLQIMDNENGGLKEGLSKVTKSTSQRVRIRKGRRTRIDGKLSDVGKRQVRNGRLAKHVQARWQK